MERRKENREAVNDWKAWGLRDEWYGELDKDITHGMQDMADDVHIENNVDMLIIVAGKTDGHDS